MDKRASLSDGAAGAAASVVRVDIETAERTRDVVDGVAHQKVIPSERATKFTTAPTNIANGKMKRAMQAVTFPPCSL